jgi:hypothetical protein
MLLPNVRFQRISNPKAIEKESQDIKHFPLDEHVREMFNLLNCHHPMFILALLPDKDGEIYGMFIPYASCLFVQSMHINRYDAYPFMCSESYGAILHVEFLNMITYEGPIGESKCLLMQLVCSLLKYPFKKMCEVMIGVASRCMVKP